MEEELGGGIQPDFNLGSTTPPPDQGAQPNVLMPGNQPQPEQGLPLGLGQPVQSHPFTAPPQSTGVTPEWDWNYQQAKNNPYALVGDLIDQKKGLSTSAYQALRTENDVSNVLPQIDAHINATNQRWQDAQNALQDAQTKLTAPAPTMPTTIQTNLGETIAAGLGAAFGGPRGSSQAIGAAEGIAGQRQATTFDNQMRQFSLDRSNAMQQFQTSLSDRDYYRALGGNLENQKFEASMHGLDANRQLGMAQLATQNEWDKAGFDFAARDYAAKQNHDFASDLENVHAKLQDAMAAKGYKREVATELLHSALTSVNPDEAESLMKTVAHVAGLNPDEFKAITDSIKVGAANRMKMMQFQHGMEQTKTYAELMHYKYMEHIAAIRLMRGSKGGTDEFGAPLPDEPTGGADADLSGLPAGGDGGTTPIGGTLPPAIGGQLKPSHMIPDGHGGFMPDPITGPVQGEATPVATPYRELSGIHSVASNGSRLDIPSGTWNMQGVPAKVSKAVDDLRTANIARDTYKAQAPQFNGQPVMDLATARKAWGGSTPAVKQQLSQWMAWNKQFQSANLKAKEAQAQVENNLDGMTRSQRALAALQTKRMLGRFTGQPQLQQQARDGFRNATGFNLDDDNVQRDLGKFLQRPDGKAAQQQLDDFETQTAARAKQATSKAKGQK